MAWLILLGAVVLAPAPAHAADQPAGGSTLRPDDRIVFIGDSITGQGWNHPRGFIHLIESSLKTKWPDGKWQVIPLGGSGAGVGAWQNFEKRSREGEVRLDAKEFEVGAALAQPADVVIVMLGMNDLLAPYVKPTEADIDAWEARYRALLDALRQRVKPRVLALATISMCSEDPASPKNQIRDRLNARLAALAAEQELTLLPVGQTMVDLLKRGRQRVPDFHVTGDYVHPNQQGHYAIAIGMLRGLGAVESARALEARSAEDLDRRAAGHANQPAAQPPPPWLVGTGLFNPQAWPGNKFDPDRGRLPCDGHIVAGRLTDPTVTGTDLVWNLYHPSVNFTGSDDPGSVDFTAVSFGRVHEVGYALRWIHSEKKRIVQLQLSSKVFAGSIGLSVWLNGHERYAGVITDEPHRRTELFAVLRPGWNILAIKCNHLTWQWQVTANLVQVNDDDLSDLHYTAEPPAGYRLIP
ncbi:hypothetical protein HED60_20845 [Planctomycetales bacterium ZRK34]|nr:hypothetical protein HED60_20845 [Planctomycetales bacterium ZRK34]